MPAVGLGHDAGEVFTLLRTFDLPCASVSRAWPLSLLHLENALPCLGGGFRRWPVAGPRLWDRYLVDSASSHMLVSKIKPCMSKYKHLYRETANGSLNQLSFI